MSAERSLGRAQGSFRGRQIRLNMSVRRRSRLNVTAARVQAATIAARSAPARVPARTPPRTGSWGRGGRLQRGGPPLEFRAVSPDGVHHDSQLAGDGHLSLLEPCAIPQPQTPLAQRRWPLNAGQQDVGGFEQVAPGHAVFGLGDPSGPVDLARLVRARREAQVWSYILGSLGLQWWSGTQGP